MVVLFTHSGVTRRGTFSLSRQREQSAETKTENGESAVLSCIARGFLPFPGDFLMITGPYAGRYRVDSAGHSKDGVFLICNLTLEGRTESPI